MNTKFKKSFVLSNAFGLNTWVEVSEPPKSYDLSYTKIDLYDDNLKKKGIGYYKNSKFVVAYQGGPFDNDLKVVKIKNDLLQYIDFSSIIHDYNLKNDGIQDNIEYQFNKWIKRFILDNQK
tara:strand:+ start:6544 stop:6906 length:363 start_codon:yes stop_codon:yes gene_type:complete